MGPESKAEIDRIVDLMKHLAPDANVDRGNYPMVQVYQNRYLAQIMALVAEEQSLSADKVENQTGKLIWLTWALVGLTVALLFFTVYLYKDTHALAQREQAASPHKAESPEGNCP